MPAEVRAAFGIAAAMVVLRRAKAAHDLEVTDGMAHRLQLLNGQLQFVEQFRIQQQVFRPDVRLILRQEIAELEVSRDGRVNVLRRHLDEAVRVRVRRRLGTSTALEWPIA